MKIDDKKLQERLNENLRKLFSYRIDDCFKCYVKEEYYIILTEELLNWLEKVGYFIYTINFLRETHLGKYIYISYYGDPLDEEAKRIVENEIDNREALKGIEIEELDDEFMDDIAKYLKDDYIGIDSYIDKLVFIRSVLQVLNDGK